MNSPSEDIKDILSGYDSSSSSPFEFGTNLFISHEPNSPDRCLTIFDTGGFDSDVHGYESPTVQIRSRDKPGNYKNAYASLVSVLDVLHGQNIIVNSTRYTFWKQGDIFYLGKDENNRVILTVNIRCQRRST